MKTKIFITGLTSTIGDYLIQYLNHTSFEIQALSRNKKTDSENLTWIQGDLSDPSSYSAALSDCDILLHMAGVTHSYDAEAYYKINFKYSLELFKRAEAYGVRKIIYLSTYTAGEESGAYGKSKFQTENYLYSQSYTWCILRPSEIFGGKKQEGIDKLVKNLKEKKFHLYPKGLKCKLKPIFIEDVAYYIFQTLNASTYDRKTLNLTGPDAIDFVDILKYAKNIRKTKFFLIPVPKSIMQGLEKILRISPIALGLVPDQIPRLYRTNQIIADIDLIGQESFLRYLDHILKK